MRKEINLLQQILLVFGAMTLVTLLAKLQYVPYGTAIIFALLVIYMGIVIPYWSGWRPGKPRK
jgi:hypothetical protein